MRYKGGKARQGKRLVAIMQPYITKMGLYYEPFVGACNVIRHVQDSVRIGGDLNSDVIALWQAVQIGWEPPEAIHRNEYETYKYNPRGLSILDHKPFERAFIGFGCAFGGNEWRGYASVDNRTYRTNPNGVIYSKNSHDKVLATLPDIQTVFFLSGTYDHYTPPLPSVIYCDPPYANTDGYKGVGEFNHDDFWQWVKRMGDEGHTIFVSELNAPEFMTEALSHGYSRGLRSTSSKTYTDKLFMYSPLVELDKENR